MPLVSLGATLVCDGCWNELVTEAIGDETPIWLDGPPAPPASE